MIKFRALLAAAGICAATAANAQAQPCPPRETGTYPWLKSGVVKGDLWAWVFLELDKNGKAKRCLMGENNVRDSDLRYFMCDAMKDDWRAASPEEAAKVASTTVKRFFVMPGPDREKQLRDARKRFFAENPNERPECYPEG